MRKSNSQLQLLSPLSSREVSKIIFDIWKSQFIEESQFNGYYFYYKYRMNQNETHTCLNLMNKAF